VQLNAYVTRLETLHGLDEVDCFIGGLVATGIPPQMLGDPSPAVQPLIHRVKYWLDLYRVYGMVRAHEHTLLNRFCFLHKINGRSLHPVFVCRPPNPRSRCSTIQTFSWSGYSVAMSLVTTEAYLLAILLPSLFLTISQTTPPCLPFSDTIFRTQTSASGLQL
jgi:hypothetical protein